ncbi:MAG: AMP-binding protein [Oscillospiraceae bacterium]|jgi:acetyl-CoA synthetase|nr:AMP-binding protein [Oscillospiraceae bacterium]
MYEILKRFCPRTEFSSYDEMKRKFQIIVPEDFNFGFDVVDAWAQLDPDKPALLWTDDSGKMRSFTFGDVRAESNRAVNFLRDKGIRKGDVVMLILKQRPEVWFLLTALHKLGAVALPASYQLTPKDLRYRLELSEAKMLITVSDDDVVAYAQEALEDSPGVKNYATVGNKAVPGAIDYRRVVGAYSPEYDRPTGAENTTVADPMLIYFSSGTTGLPKMVRHDHSSPLGHITNALFWQRVGDGKVHLTQTDSGWAKFAWGKIYGQWICGACIGIYDTEKFVPQAMLEAIGRLKPYTFCAPATIYRFLIKEDLSGYDFSYISHASLAGEPLNPEVFRQIETKTALRIYEGFGQSEGSVLLANFPWDKIRPGSMGKPSPIYNIFLMREDGTACEDGEVGAICIRNARDKHPTGLFREYWKDTAATDKAFAYGHYSTGDTAWRDADGYYWFVGRNDDVIKCSGYRIGPFEVESALMEHPSVLECAVTAYPDPLRGEVVKATIVLARGFTGSDDLKKELQNLVKHVTAPYKYPRVVEFVDELPKTSSGKIRRTAIRAADMQKLQVSK